MTHEAILTPIKQAVDGLSVWDTNLGNRTGDPANADRLALTIRGDFPWQGRENLMLQVEVWGDWLYVFCVDFDGCLPGSFVDECLDFPKRFELSHPKSLDAIRECLVSLGITGLPSFG